MKRERESAAPPKPRRRTSELLYQGQRMSNWMYNVSQNRNIPEQLREDMKEMVKEWDKLKREGGR